MLLAICYTTILNAYNMKTSTKTHIILKALDKELRKLITADLAQFKAVKSGNNQGSAKQAA